jgi:hypothetical protein
MVASTLTSTLIGEVVLIALIGVVLLVMLKMGKGVKKVVGAIVVNSVLGVAAIFTLNYFFNTGIPVHLYTLIPTALFGLPAVGTFIIFKFFGVFAIIL